MLDVHMVTCVTRCVTVSTNVLLGYTVTYCVWLYIWLLWIDNTHSRFLLFVLYADVPNVVIGAPDCAR
jgi:hypothetical protein